MTNIDILFYPDAMRGNRIKWAIENLNKRYSENLNITYHNDINKHFDIFIYWSYHAGVANMRFTLREPDDFIKTNNPINMGCYDISKSKLNRIFDNILVDPSNYNGLMVEKSEMQGTHDGKVIQGPIPKAILDLQKNRSYQKYIDTLQDDGNYICYRTYFSGQIDFIMKKYSLGQFRPNYTKLELVTAEDTYTPEQIKWINEKCDVFGLELGELDILKDKKGEIFVVDINNVCGFEHLVTWKDVIGIQYQESIKNFLLKTTKKTI